MTRVRRAPLRSVRSGAHVNLTPTEVAAFDVLTSILGPLELWCDRCGLYHLVGKSG